MKNHGVLQDFVESMFHVTRWLFDLRMSQKMMFHIRNSDVALRGYIGPFESPTIDPFSDLCRGHAKAATRPSPMSKARQTSACQLHGFLVA
ncbi:2-oxoglutarate and iron-dependent oxygenase domain-containing protein [Mesorhizobium sp. M0618]|uniref:2-oxoglutarate and iron-dependent oxygenase domain-containing protein n=1 Tax=unclassified Mesorhizobium TaxID=325217 RepID=UPI0033355D24